MTSKYPIAKERNRIKHEEKNITISYFLFFRVFVVKQGSANKQC